MKESTMLKQMKYYNMEYLNSKIKLKIKTKSLEYTSKTKMIKTLFSN